ncbi:MAG TPA: glycosyltransferase [Bryobacteraceae bacterium]
MTRKRIIYVQYTNPAAYPPLEHSSRILAESDWDVLFLGTGALGADKLRFDDHPRISVRRLRFQPPGIRQKLHYAFFNLWCLGWFLRRRPDCVYFSELHSCPLGLLSALIGMRAVFHEHDIPQSKSTGAFARLLSWSRNQFARRATLCVVPNAKRGEHMVRSTGASRMPAVVWNCPRSEEAAGVRDPLAQGKVRVLYHGSIVPDRLPLAVIESLAMLPDGVTLTVAGYETTGARGYIDTLKKKATELGIANRLEIAGTVPLRRDLMAICRQHDVGLALMPLESGDPNMETMAGASNKPYDYLACGLALLVAELPDWEEMFVKPGYGLSCNPSSIESLTAALGFFVAEPETTRSMGERGRQRILRDWNYEHQFQVVRERLAGPGLDAAAEPDRTRNTYRSEAIR